MTTGEVIALIKAFGGGGGGSSGGGVLVVHVDADTGALDKTWQEINDADLSVLFFNDGSRKYFAYCASVDANKRGWEVVYANVESDGTVYASAYIADSADGYPAYSE